MKRALSILLATVLIISMLTPCYAIENDTVKSSNYTAESNTTITPRYAYILTNSVDFSINQNTQVTTSDVYCLLYGNYEVQIVCELQRYNNSRWYTLKTWTASGMQEASLTKTLAVARGYTYRAYATFYIYDNNGHLLETATNYDSVYLPSN